MENIFQTDIYIDSIEKCYKDAKNDYDQSLALYQSIQKDYTAKVAEYNKCKSYEDKLQATIDLATQVGITLNNIELIIDSELNEPININLNTIKLMVCEVKNISEHIEHYYNCCLLDLISRIEKITDLDLDRSGGIIAALEKLREEYGKALQAAHNALMEVFEALKMMYILRYRATPPNSNSNHDRLSCSEMARRLNQSADSTNASSNQATAVCDEVTAPGEGSCEVDHQDSLRARIGKIKVEFDSKFTEITVNDGGTSIKMLTTEYFTSLKNKTTTAKSQRDQAEDNFSKAKQCKDLKKSKMDALEASFNAAKAAKAC